MAGSLPWRPLDRRRHVWINRTTWAVWTAAVAVCIASGSANGAGIASIVARAAINISSPSTVNVNGSASTATTAIDPQHLHPRVMTYRNAYGTHFVCNSTCYFTMIAYMVSIVSVLVLLTIVPVQSPSKPEHAPFLLWFGNNSPAQDDGKPLEPHENGLLDRLSLWLGGRKEYVKQQDETPEIESDPESSSQEEIEVVSEEAEPVKTFESIGVETDDSLLPALFVTQPADFVVVEDVDSLFEFAPLTSPSRKPGIFSPATPKEAPPHVDVGSPRTSVPPERGSIVRRESVSPRSPVKSASTGGRRATVIGGPPSESVLVAVERRNSMQKRADKRKEHARSDIAHDNLHEHELHMYEYLEFIREMLEGASIKKVCQKSAKVVKRSFFLTPDLSVVYWNQMGTKGWTSKKSSFETVMIDKVIAGIHGSANLQSKGKQDKQQQYLSVILKGGKQLDLEAKDEKTRHRLVLGFTRLASEKRDELEKKKQAKEEAERTAQQEQAASPRQAAIPQQSEEAHRSADERRAKSEEDGPEQWRKEQHEQAIGSPGTNQADEEMKR